MSQTASSLFAQEPSLGMGVVQSRHGEAVLVAGPAGLVRALRAADCLLLPEAGDRVLLLMGDRQAYVLSVLARNPAASGANILLPANARVESADGRLELSGTEVGVRGATVRIEGEHLSLAGRCLSLTGAVLRQQAEVAVTVAHKIMQVAATLTQKAGQCTLACQRRTANVADVDEVRAGRIRLGAETSFRVRSARADLRAEGQFSVDGERINIG